MKKILSRVRKACENYNLIEENDKIAVGLSGGKDSLVLLNALAIMRKFYPKKFELIAITVDLFNGQSNYEKVLEFCKDLDVPLHIVPSQIFEIVFTERKETNPCSLCAKMRRGILNQTAKDLGCTKVALGHHADDLIETFFLSLIYEGRLSTFAPKTYLSNTDITSIRPLIYLKEKEVLSASKNLPVFKNECPANHKTKREFMKDMLKDLEKKIPGTKDIMFKAITSPERYNLFDKHTKDINKK